MCNFVEMENFSVCLRYRSSGRKKSPKETMRKKSTFISTMITLLLWFPYMLYACSWCGYDRKLWLWLHDACVYPCACLDLSQSFCEADNAQVCNHRQNTLNYVLSDEY